MKALLVYPRYPDTFWSFKYALSFVRRKAAFPPLGLLTVAAMLPADWELKVVDLNVENLEDADLQWAELVFISAMVVQKDSTLEVMARCNVMGRKIVAGGPLFTHLHAELAQADHIIAGEAEEVLPEFLADLASGRAKRLYKCEEHPALARTPQPRWELINLKNYRSMALQFSRGCPFDCDFCDVVVLFGRKPRFKSAAQVLAELDSLHALGWRGTLMVVDDNFIGNKVKAKELLRAMIAWQEQRRYPFTFLTQASVNLADDPELLSLMASANFNEVFLGLETPSSKALVECNKRQNQGRDLVAAVKTIQSYGIEVMAGFIVGFDADSPSIFMEQVRFITQAAIPTAMVGLLSLLPGTRLYEKMRQQERLLDLPSGDNAMDAKALNFIPKMGAERLLEGYRALLERLYEPKEYYRRAVTYLRRSGRELKHSASRQWHLSRADLAAMVRIFWRLGIRERHRLSYWGFLARVGFTRPTKIPVALALAATGYHFRKITSRFGASLPEPADLTSQR